MAGKNDGYTAILEELEAANDCLIMIAERLEILGPVDGYSLQKTAAMFYPEWISCLVEHLVKKAKKEAPCEKTGD